MPIVVPEAEVPLVTGRLETFANRLLGALPIPGRDVHCITHKTGGLSSTRELSTRRAILSVESI